MDLATLKIISQALDAADMLADLVTRFGGSRDKIKQLIAEDRDPTDEEWASVRSERDANTAIIEDA